MPLIILTTIRFLVILNTLKYRRFNNLDIVKACLNPEVNDDILFFKLHDRWPDNT